MFAVILEVCFWRADFMFNVREMTSYLTSALLNREWREKQNTHKHTHPSNEQTHWSPQNHERTHWHTPSLSLLSLITGHLAAVPHNLRQINSLSMNTLYVRGTSDKWELLCELFKQTEGLKSFSSHHKKSVLEKSLKA